MKTTDTYKILNMYCDRFGNLSYRNLANLMLEVSLLQGKSAEANLDMSRLRWVLYSWDIDMDYPIFADDILEISAYAVKLDKFYAYKDFEILRAGQVVGLARGIFLLVDIDRKRPVKFTDALVAGYDVDEPIYTPPKLSYREDFDISKRIAIRSSDIDGNFHVNNAVYFDIICDLCKVDARDISYFNMVYKNEIRNKDYILGEYRAMDDEIDFRLRSTDDNKVYTYGKIIRNA